MSMTCFPLWPRSEGFSRRRKLRNRRWFGARTTPQPPKWAATFLATMDWARVPSFGVLGGLELACSFREGGMGLRIPVSGAVYSCLGFRILGFVVEDLGVWLCRFGLRDWLGFVGGRKREGETPRP